MNELMIYQVFPLRALTDGQPSHGILEMIDWIPHIKKLGMNAVYFSPVFYKDAIRIVPHFTRFYSYCTALNASSRSWMMSSMFSVPMDRRIVFGLIP